MITWMQRHKKWLIITIWISTIAFIGAGFVGWGSYDYGKSNSTIAIVGDKEVPLNDLQDEYSALYAQYQKMLGGQFTKEMAKQFGLEDIAYKKVIQKYLLLKFAEDLGLAVTDDEVAKELLKIKAFYNKDGKFDKNIYLTVLQQNRQTAAKFEQGLKRDLLAQKVQKIFSSKLTNNELNNLKALFYSKDKVSIAILKKDDIDLQIKEEQLKKFYNDNKQNYKSPIGYKIVYTKIDCLKDKTKKQMKKIALKEYLKLKKGTSKFKFNTILYKEGELFNLDEFNKIILSKEGKVLKPIYSNNSYYIVKLLEKTKPEILSYSKVKDIVKTDYKAFKIDELLQKKAKELLKNFKGKSIGYISRDKNISIDGLNNVESAKLTGEIFDANKKRGIVKFDFGIVVFNIEDTVLGKNIQNSVSDDIIKNLGENIKAEVAIGNLLKQLQTKYEIKSFMGK